MPEAASTAGLAPALVGFYEEAAARDFVMEFCEKSARVVSRYTPRWDEMLDNYMVVPLGGDQRWAFPAIGGIGQPAIGKARTSRLKDPETHQIVESLAAQGLGILLSAKDYIQAIPIGEDDPQKARLLARLLMAVLEMPGVYRTQYQLLKDSFLFGTSIVEIGWETRGRMQMTEVPDFDESGFYLGTKYEPRPTIYRNGPSIRSVDIYDFRPDPSGTRIQHDMMGAAKRFRISPQAAMDLARSGVYNREAVERAVQNARNRAGVWQGSAERERFDNSGIPKDTHRDMGLLVGLEYYGRVPFRVQDGATNRVVTLLEGEVVRSHINPYLDGNIPFKEIVVNPIAGRFYGLSPAEVVRYLQDSADNMLMVLNDAADIMVRPGLLMGAGYGGDPSRLARREFNDVIPCANPEMVKPIPTELNALQFAAIELGRRKMAMREASGATNPVQSVQSSGEQTATEISTLAHYASQRIDSMVMLIERDDYPWIGRTIHSRLRQFGSDDGYVATLNGEQIRVSLKDIDMEADVRFVGSRQAQSAYQTLAAIREAFNVLGTNPMVIAQYPDLGEMYFDKMGLPNGRALVARAVQYAQMLQEQQMAISEAKQVSGNTVGRKQLPMDNMASTTQQEGQAIA